MPRESLDFSTRATLTEWMDEPCTFADFRACLADIARANRVLLAYTPTLAWLETILVPSAPPVHIVDVGCGGGDMLRRIERWALRRNIAVQLTGIDLNPHAAHAAREFTPPDSRIAWVTGDAFTYVPPGSLDLVISSLFTHHLPDDEIVRFLAWMEQVATRGWFINDLHRGRTPYYAFKALSGAMRLHRFVRHDGPVSIRRSFSAADWQRYASAAGLSLPDLRIFTPGIARLCVAREKPWTGPKP